jgi:hypothetical protein
LNENAYLVIFITMNTKLIFIVLLSAACSSPKQTVESPTNQLPVVTQKPANIPAKENFYIFFMAGQSNMAGRGIVQGSDTVPSSQVLMLDKNNEWVYAKEPLHFYEPGRTGLDCGLSFGKELAKKYPKDITIGLVPCAVGGSSIQHWLGDSTYRNVKLYSNLLKKADIASQAGTIKGMIWHQGESNANVNSYKNYRQHLETFFARVRKDLGYAEMPIYAGELASFLSRKQNPKTDAINADLHAMEKDFANFYVINTQDFTPKSDSIHFDSKSQRLMGIRFAQKVLTTK